VPTIAAIATVAVSALACAKRLPKSIQTPLFRPSTGGVAVCSRGALVATVSGRVARGDLSTPV
jgi:hypothetical protein